MSTYTWYNYYDSDEIRDRVIKQWLRRNGDYHAIMIKGIIKLIGNYADWGEHVALWGGTPLTTPESSSNEDENDINTEKMNVDEP